MDFKRKSLDNNRKLKSFTIYVLLFHIIIIIFLRLRTEDVEKYPVDVVYKYIDLSDQRLNRRGYKQVAKDHDDNNELLYSLRSVFMNIPWVRKIFIIMPNKDLPFLNNTEDRKQKIVYIRDKDLTGFDSSSSVTYELNGLWRLKKFDVSDQIIYMNDDCFIGRKMKKKDFFYYSIKEKRIVPYIMIDTPLTTRNYQRVEDFFWENHELLNVVGEHRGIDYTFQMINAYRLLYKVFKDKNIKLPRNLKKSWHNTTPLSLKDLTMIHYLIKNNYEYADECFYAKYRTNKQLVMYALYTYYFLNKNNRQVGNVEGCYRTLHNFNENTTIKGDLICINTGTETVSDENKYCEKMFLENTFKDRMEFEVE